MLSFFLSCEKTLGVTVSESISGILNVSFSNLVTSITENNLTMNGIIKDYSLKLTIRTPYVVIALCPCSYNSFLKP
tara:strand:+ start:516 stop:743 length:228 start_codon:yes stop_codon:yes gene_type:complete